MAVNHPFDMITTNISFLRRNPFKHNLYIRRKRLEKTEENGQSRDTGSIGYTKNRPKTIKRHWQHWVHKTQAEDNQETLAALGTQDTGRRQSRDTGSIGYTRHRMKTNKHVTQKTKATSNTDPTNNQAMKPGVCEG